MSRCGNPHDNAMAENFMMALQDRKGATNTSLPTKRPHGRYAVRPFVALSAHRLDSVARRIVVRFV
jgi:transposase InsO family protein